MTKMTGHIALLGLVLVSCTAKPARSTAQVEQVQSSPEFVLWSLCPSPCIDRSARFAAYPSGVVIFFHNNPLSEAPRYMKAELSRAEYEKLLGPDQLKALSGLDESYLASDGGNGPDHILQWKTGDGRVRQMKVIGNLDDDDHDRRRTPPAFLTLFDALVSFNTTGARPYVPEAVAVRLRPMHSSPMGSVLWPAEWPAPIPTSRKDPVLNNRSFLEAVLPGARFEEAYRWILEHQTNGLSVEFKGESYHLDMQAVLPGHPVIPSIPDPVIE